MDHKRIDLELNSLGVDGWELVSVVPIAEDDQVVSMCYFLKRHRDEVIEGELVGVGR